MNIKKSIVRETFNQIVLNKTLRRLLVNKLDRMLHNALINGYGIPALPAEKKQKYYYISSIMHTTCDHLDKGFINPKVTRKMVDVFTQGGLKTDRVKTLNPAKEAYKKKYGEYPPLFCVLSPTKACNLACVGCYATSDRQSTPKLDYETTRKVVQDVHDTFGSRFITISGGEPFLYFDHIIKIMTQAQKEKLGPLDTIETNAFWATDKKTIVERLSCSTHLVCID